ncbi:MAG: transporter permease [Ilumatobacteraceae bacterium]|nr:transporter permease [Ilumatobacteraceae bacterium]
MTAFTVGGSTRSTRSTTASGAPKNRHKKDVLRIVLAVWCVIVLIFLFVPICLVVLHSFNRGGSFSIWSGHTSTKWWGTLFDADKAWSAALTIIVFTVVGSLLPPIVRKTTGWQRTFISRWFGPFAFLLGVVVVALNTDWYRNVFKDKNLGDALRNSFFAAIGATIVAVVLGGLSGVALARRPGFWTKPFMLMVFLILVTPEIMDAIALAGWMQRFSFGLFKSSTGGIDGGIFRLWVGESLYASAVVTLIVRARLAGIDETLEEAASDLGATPGRAFRQITLPLISSALVAGGLLSFTICLDNTIIAEQIATAGSTTFPTYLISQLRSTVKPFVGSAAVVLFIVTIGALAFVATVLKRSGDSSSQIAATLGGG